MPNNNKFHRRKEIKDEFIKQDSPQFRCIININTNIWEKGQWCRRQRSRSNSENHSFKKHARSEVVTRCVPNTERSKDRIVPQCFRDCKCNGGRHRIFQNSYDSNAVNIKETKIKNKKSRCKMCRKCSKKDKVTKQSSKKDKVVKKSRKRIKKDKIKKETNCFSPISSITLSVSDVDMSYEEISSDTIDSDYEINTLIQRTKDLEKHTDKFHLKPETFAPSPESFYTSNTPHDLITLSSETETSSHSVETIKLEPLATDAYSPSQAFFPQEESFDGYNSNADSDGHIILSDKKTILDMEQDNDTKSNTVHLPAVPKNIVHYKHVPIPVVSTKPEKCVKREMKVVKSNLKQEPYSWQWQNCNI